jgi:hypothetical protein
MMPEGLITAASFSRAEDDSWIQVLGRLSQGRLNVSFSWSFDSIGHRLFGFEQVSLCSW